MEAPPIINTSFPEGSSNFGKGWTVKGVLYGGVDYSKAGNGGPACLAALSPMHRFPARISLRPKAQRWVFGRWVETVLVVTLVTTECLWAWKQLQIPLHFKPRPHNAALRRWITLLLGAVFGVEIGFKFCSRTALYLLNPCHILTAIQLFLLASEGRDRVSCLLFRLQVYLLTGPVLALLFPVLNTLKQPLEVEWYYIQHYTILLVPLYLLSLGGAYTAEPLWDFHMALFSASFLILYHFVFLQALGLMSWVNLNHMLCAAISDPFPSRWWRTAAVFHQHLCVPLVGKFFFLFARFLNSISATVPSVFQDECTEVLGPIVRPVLAPVPSPLGQGDKGLLASPDLHRRQLSTPSSSAL